MKTYLCRYVVADYDYLFRVVVHEHPYQAVYQPFVSYLDQRFGRFHALGGQPAAFSGGDYCIFHFLSVCLTDGKITN